VDEDGDGLRARTREGLFSFREEKPIGVVNVRLKFFESFSLAHDPWDFDQLADIPVSIFPVLESQGYLLHGNHLLK